LRLLPLHSGVFNPGRRRCGAVIERIIGVPAGIEGIEGVAVVLVERQSEPDALRQIGISDEVPAECYKVRISFFDNHLGVVSYISRETSEM